MERRLAAIMAADMVGYSRLMAADEGGTFGRQKSLRKDVIDARVAEHGGRIVKATGDGFLAEFPSVVAAVMCATDIQRAVAEREAPQTDQRRIQYRIGINLGDIVADEGDVFGEGVNLAARLEGLAEPGGICISETVYQNVKSMSELVFEKLAPRTVKNIPGQIQTYKVLPASAPAPTSVPFIGRLVLPDKPSIAVLPFVNMSSDREQDYFADGITEDLITAFSRVQNLFVISRNSSFVYKGRAVRIQDVARELGVRYVLEGSIRVAGKRVRVTAQLIDGMTGNHAWAERFDATLDDIFEVQDEITHSIALAMQVKLTLGETARLWEGKTKNLRAWEKMVIGRELFYRWDMPDNSRLARVELEKALQIDPNYTGAMAQLGMTYWWDARAHTSIDKEYALQMAEQQVGRIRTLDPDMSIAHMLEGGIAFLRDQHEEALKLCQRALELAPSDSWAVAFYGLICLYAGKDELAVATLKAAMRLSPHYPSWYTYNLALAYLWLPDLEEAEKAAIAYRETEDEPFAHLLLATVYGFQQRFNDAQRVVADLRTNFPSFTTEEIVRSQRYKDPQRLEQVLQTLRSAGFDA